MNHQQPYEQSEQPQEFKEFNFEDVTKITADHDDLSIRTDDCTNITKMKRKKRGKKARDASMVGAFVTFLKALFGIGMLSNPGWEWRWLKRLTEWAELNHPNLLRVPTKLVVALGQVEWYRAQGDMGIGSAGHAHGHCAGLLCTTVLVPPIGFVQGVASLLGPSSLEPLI